MPRFVSALMLLRLVPTVSCDRSASKNSGAASGSMMPPILLGTPPSNPDQCLQPLADPGDDPCLSCALAHCCTQYTGACLDRRANSFPGRKCYDDAFLPVQQCFRDAISAHPEQRSVLATSRCNSSPGGPSFWSNDASVYWLTKCLVGWRARVELGEDAGDLAARTTGQPCASGCFPGWH
jgi:hypothetical protein